MWEWEFMLPSHTVGLLDGRTVPHYPLLCRSQLKWLQDLTVGRKCHNAFHNQLPLLLCCSSLSYPKAHPLLQGFRLSLAWTVSVIQFDHVRVLVQRSPPAHVWPEPSSLLTQAAPHPPRQHVTVIQVNTEKDTPENFKKKLIPTLIYIFFQGQKTPLQ